MRRDRGTKKVPNIGNHTQFSIMTTEANAIVEPIHEKAMPVMLMTPEDVEQWLKGGSVEDTLKMQKPAPDDAIVIRPEEKKVAERRVRTYFCLRSSARSATRNSSTPHQDGPSAHPHGQSLSDRYPRVVPHGRLPRRPRVKRISSNANPPKPMISAR
jgi:hypothetical protein